MSSSSSSSSFTSPTPSSPFLLLHLFVWYPLTAAVNEFEAHHWCCRFCSCVSCHGRASLSSSSSASSSSSSSLVQCTVGFSEPKMKERLHSAVVIFDITAVNVNVYQFGETPGRKTSTFSFSLRLCTDRLLGIFSFWYQSEKQQCPGLTSHHNQ